MKSLEALERLKRDLEWYFTLNKEQDEAYNLIKADLEKLDKIENLLGRSELDPYEILCLINKVIEGSESL